MYIKKLEIGELELENNVFLAPMAGITDKAFRIICEEYNPGLVVTEMASAKAIHYGDEKTKVLLDVSNEKRPISVQIFGSDITAIKTACEYVTTFADIIDINMGCPAPKVIKNGDGSKLLLDLKLAERIIKTAVNNSKVPVSVKMRSGWSSQNIVATDLAKIAEDSGASMITIHGRTREQFYAGEADLDIIKRVKESVLIPVIGNGDVTDMESAKRMFDYTGVDGIMIGRAAVGNPWIFKEIVNMKKETISHKEKLEVMIKHIELECVDKGENIGVKEMRKHLAAYVKNLKDATKLRNCINKVEEKDELIDTLKKFFKELD